MEQSKSVPCLACQAALLLAKLTGTGLQGINLTQPRRPFHLLLYLHFSAPTYSITDDNLKHFQWLRLFSCRAEIILYLWLGVWAFRGHFDSNEIWKINSRGHITNLTKIEAASHAHLRPTCFANSQMVLTLAFYASYLVILRRFLR